MVVGARQSFQFFRQITWFLENNRALSKFRSGFCITSLVLSYKKLVPKSQFHLKHTSHLNVFPHQSICTCSLSKRYLLAFLVSRLRYFAVAEMVNFYFMKNCRTSCRKIEKFKEWIFKCLLKFCKINFCFTERKKFTWANNTIEQVSDSSIDHLYKLEDSKP